MELGNHTPGQAARDALHAQVPPLDLSRYQNPAGGAGVLAGPPVVNRCVPGVGPAAAADVARLSGSISTVGRACHQLSDEQLGDLVTDLLEVSDRAERSLVFVLADAITRGVISSSGAGSPVQWLTGKLPCLEPAQAHRIVRAAAAVLDPVNAPLTAALAAGEVTVRCAVTALRQLPKVTLALPGATREELLGYFLTVAGTGTSTDLNDLAKKVIATYGGESAPRDEEVARSAESLTFRDLPCGLTRITADLSRPTPRCSAPPSKASPNHAPAPSRTPRQTATPPRARTPAVVTARPAQSPGQTSPRPRTARPATLASPLPPAPRRHLARDPRSAGKRRADALLGVPPHGAKRAGESWLLRRGG